MAKDWKASYDNAISGWIAAMELARERRDRIDELEVQNAALARFARRINLHLEEGQGYDYYDAFKKEAREALALASDTDPDTKL